ncbi:DUF2513 domain-containing protein [Staphylococcus epidermidis]|mgnify:FL=1|uniref:DUF2513 domain-containing protein n=1 Tax=Staphylococcus epidermidis TaxID=1282 RepID=UPI00026BF8EB|nr:DUF2513 domain-containing protein [Staphylococcus epidermidis]EJE24503.1 hypothetical protein HMPREF9975_05906 [Staphylococcus epidermidis NIHLM001]MCG2451898.1 DUF2513 domain-containing protein [Staphylococcus epidermidis]MCO6259278.1 DUF2513 domain-containing protein [Staphylococcus epidermidis]NJI76856.1 DUF2513 domain-containing protein [Staphylococcus epidermidis]
MRLNYDCIRDILLTIEDMDYTSPGMIKENFENQSRVKKYEPIQILYTLKRLSDVGFINVLFAKGEAFYHFYNVHSMTFSGHQLLDDIRDEKVWQKTKDKASKLSSVSIPVLQQLATSVAKQTFGLQ